jgi:hypothetical protein
LIPTDPNLPKGHSSTDAGSGQHKQGSKALEHGGAGVVLKLESLPLALKSLIGIEIAQGAVWQGRIQMAGDPQDARE